MPGEEQLPPSQVQLLPQLRLSLCSQASEETAFLSKEQKAKGSGTSVVRAWNLIQPGWVTRTAGSGSVCLHKGARHLFCPHRDHRIHKIRKDPKHVPGNIVLGCSRRRDLTCIILLLYMVTDGQHLTKKEKTPHPISS